MKKKPYEKPSTKVYELQQQCQILASSPSGTIPGSDPYTPGSNPFSF